MFTRPARHSILFYATDHFIQLARLDHQDERAVLVDSLAELKPAEADAIDRWLRDHFASRGHSGWLPVYAGFHPEDRVLAREQVNTRHLADPAYLPGLVAKSARIASAQDWQVAALHTGDGPPLAVDGGTHPALLFGVAQSAVRREQTRLLELGLRPRRLEVGTLSLLGGLTSAAASTVRANAGAIVVCEIERAQTRVYVIAKDGAHTLPPLPHGLLSMEEAALKELGAPDVAAVRARLEAPAEDLRARGRRLVRVLSRHLKPAVDHFEVRTGFRIDALFCAHLPAGLAWLGEALGAAVDLELFNPDLAAWLPAAGLKIAGDGPPPAPGWLPALSLIAQLAPPAHALKP